MSKTEAIVVGAGIAGLAMARALAIKGYRVRVIDKDHHAVGASIRNFGMVWPIGQPSGILYDTAKRSSAIWKELCSAAGLFCDPVGSFHLAYHHDEATVLEELYELYREERQLRLMKPDEVLQRSEAVVPDGLRLGLNSSDELIVDPREAISSLPSFFNYKFGIEFIWHKHVISVGESEVRTTDQVYRAQLVVVCSGANFENIFPEIAAEHKATKCKLQMMRLFAQPGNWRIGPALCGGLSLIHYSSFKAASSLNNLRKRYENEMPEYLKWGIHVMVSQNGRGELTVGDSHEYGGTHDPFDKQFINDLILKYLDRFAKFRENRVLESWNGVYTKLANGSPYFFNEAKPGVFVFNGLGGAGMTLSFGLAEKLVDPI